jgi:hypothetical protein
MLSGVSNAMARSLALLFLGPLAISVDAGDWHDYESGIFAGGNHTNPELDHLVQLVGYGTETKENGGAKYWLVRNSWTPLWGHDGYIKLARPAKAGGVVGSPRVCVATCLCLCWTPSSALQRTLCTALIWRSWHWCTVAMPNPKGGVLRFSVVKSCDSLGRRSAVRLGYQPGRRQRMRWRASDVPHCQPLHHWPCSFTLLGKIAHTGDVL